MNRLSAAPKGRPETVSEVLTSNYSALRGEKDRVGEMLDTHGALIAGHFRLLGGMHTDHFFRFSAIARDPSALDTITSWIVPDVERLSIDAVLAPTTAGVGLGWTLATSLGVPLYLASLDGEARPMGVLGEPNLGDRRLVLVKDVGTTGHGLKAMAQLAEDRGADVAGASWFLTRSEIDVEALLGVTCCPVAAWHLPAWEAKVCAACGAGDEPQLAYDLN